MYKLYSLVDTHETIFETWGASTKHPDARFHFSDFNKCEWVDEKNQVIPWLFECASKMALPIHAIFIAQFALEFVE